MITIKDVVVNIVCLASEAVFLIAKANDIAPRKPTSKLKLFWKKTIMNYKLPAKNNIC